MSAQLGRENVHDLEPQDVARGLAEGKVLLVDVREPVETQVERYPEAFYLPMSQFDPAAIPDPQGRQVVFACRSGNRSVTASLMAQAAGLPYDAHLAGGIKAWKALGLRLHRFPDIDQQDLALGKTARNILWFQIVHIFPAKLG